MSGGHFGSTFHTYDLQPQAKCKNQMYVSMKRMSKVGETLHQPGIAFSPTVAGASLSCPPVLVGQANISKNCAFQASNICARSKSRRDLGTCESVKVKGDQDHPPKPVTGFLVGWE